MEFRDSPTQAEWREEVRAFLKKENPPRQPEDGNWESGGDPEAMKTWRTKLAKRGWIAPAWPKEYGGAGLGVVEQFIMNEEFAEARAVSMGGSGVGFLGPTLITYGNDDQKKEHLSRILSGETQWCQGYSEPGSGSDLASLQTRAVRDGDDFVINGQKIWTSGAHTAQWMFMLARTDPDAPKHRGISYFLLDMKTPGVSVRPLINMANRLGFNEVFFEDVRVPAKNVVGEVNRGWYIGATTLDFERSSIGSAVGQRQTLETYINYIREHKLGTPNVRRDFTERWIETAAARLMSYRVISIQAAGRVPNHEASIAKLYNSELSQRISQSAMRAFGMIGGITDPARAPLRGRAALSYLSSVSSTIAGGTSEVQRNVIATRGLGLPRA
jgi:alkylation response protein AidB-like acyl-CoA dehydrogenase